MNPTISKLAACCTLLLGVCLWGGMARKLDAENRFSHEPNVGCIKGSPYGKVLALAMQGPIDFYWHKGKSHEDEVILAADKKSGHEHGEHCADSCDDHSGHDHVGHNHDAPEQTHSGEHAEDCGCEVHGADANRVVAAQDKPLHIKAKMQIKKMAASAHRKTDGKPLSPAHQQYLQGVTEDKLRLAYELDPSNYTNYGNYHLFIATTTFGKSEGDDDAAVALARRTLEFCKKDQADPASWITAASAAYNIICHIGRYYEGYTIPEAKAILAEFDYCKNRYVKLRSEATTTGLNIPEKRLKEMDERVRYLTRLREAQGIYMKRVMSTQMAHSPSIHSK